MNPADRVPVPTIAGVPVLLPAHDHPEFGDPGRHYHVDYRYCPDRPLQNRVLFSDADPVYIELAPVRPNGYVVESEALRLAIDLSMQFAGQSAKCGRCPHKGLPVYHGVCTGHGIAFDRAGCVVPPDALVLRVGSAVLPVSPGCDVYTFSMPERESVACVELVTAFGQVIARCPFTGGRIVSVDQGDTLKVQLSPVHLPASPRTTNQRYQ